LVPLESVQLSSAIPSGASDGLLSFNAGAVASYDHRQPLNCHKVGLTLISSNENALSNDEPSWLRKKLHQQSKPLSQQTENGYVLSDFGELGPHNGTRSFPPNQRLPQVDMSQRLAAVHTEDSLTTLPHKHKEKNLGMHDEVRKTMEPRDAQSDAITRGTDPGVDVYSTINGRRVFDLSLVRPWVPSDHMDMGVVYQAKKLSDGFLVRTHESLVTNPFPGNAFMIGQKLLEQQELLMKGFKVTIPPRTGYEARGKKVETLKNLIGKRSVAQVSLKPVRAVAPMSTQDQLGGNVSYNGRSNTSWQLGAVGAAVPAKNKALTASTITTDDAKAQKAPSLGPIKASGDQKATALRASPSKERVEVNENNMTYYEGVGSKASLVNQQRSPSLKPKKQASTKKHKQEVPKASEPGKFLQPVEEADNMINEKRRRKRTDTVGEQATHMNTFFAKVKKRKTNNGGQVESTGAGSNAKTTAAKSSIMAPARTRGSGEVESTTRTTVKSSIREKNRIPKPNRHGSKSESEHIPADASERALSQRNQASEDASKRPIPQRPHVSVATTGNANVRTESASSSYPGISNTAGPPGEVQDRTCGWVGCVRVCGSPAQLYVRRPLPGFSSWLTPA
jgi:hypothetical protein